MSGTRAIWKFEIEVVDEFTLEMPAGDVIHVAAQYDKPCLWAVVDPESSSVTRTFYVRGTGHPVDADLVHLGSFALHDGSFVGHLFERRLF